MARLKLGKGWKLIDTGVRPVFVARPAAKRIIVFADESGQTSHRYAAVGGTFGLSLKKDLGEYSNRQLQRFKDKARIKGAIKWDKIPSDPSSSFFKAYRDYVVYFFKQGLTFQAVLQDTHSHPLKHRDHNWGQIRIGLSKLYYQLLRTTILGGGSPVTDRRRAEDFNLHVVIDGQIIGESVSLEKLRDTISYSARRDYGLDDTFDLVKFEPTSIRDSNLLQMNDLLLGAVTARWNKSCSSKGKMAFIEGIEKRLGQSLNEETPYGEKKFRIWHHRPGLGAKASD